MTDTRVRNINMANLTNGVNMGQKYRIMEDFGSFYMLRIILCDGTIQDGCDEAGAA